MRQRRELVSQREHLRVMVEPGADCAIWSHDGPLGEEDIRRIGVSTALRVALDEWLNEFVRYDAGDATALQPGKWERRGSELAQEVAKEIGARYAVQYRPTFRAGHRSFARAGLWLLDRVRR